MRARRAGFTLIEVLVALVILATLAGVLVVSLPGFDDRRATRQAERLAALLALACEQAELSGREIGIHLARTGYGFSIGDRERWLPYPPGHRFEPRELQGVELATPSQPLPDVVEFEDAPQAACWPTGELSALDVRLAHEGRERLRVRTLVDGSAIVETAPGDGAGRDWQPLR